MKTQEVPPILRGFHSVFREIAYRWNYSEVFDDFLTLAICCHAWRTEEPLYFQTIKKYSKEELNLFPKLLAEWMLLHSRYQQENKGAKPAPWFDALGTFYEILKSQYKAQALGQFFTPPGVSEVMAQLTYEKAEEPQTIYDPACGSGRFLLAMDALEPGKHTFYGADLDNICVKMTALNMMIHGLKGQVWHMNSLTLEYFGGWDVNRMLKLKGLPSIFRLKNKDEQEETNPQHDAHEDTTDVFKLEF